MGRLVGWVKAKQAAEREGKPVKKLVSKYKDKSGKLRYKGEKALKSSELGPQLLIVYYQSFTTFQHTPVFFDEARVGSWKTK